MVYKVQPLKLVFLSLLALMLFISPLLSATSYAADGNAAAEAEAPAPQNLRVLEDSITATSATIEWDHVEELNDIDIWLADGDVYFEWGNSGSKTITTLKPETTYRLYITWFSQRPAANKSNIIEFTTPAGEVPPPSVPTAGATDLQVSNITHNSVELTWKNAPGIDDYWIWSTAGTYLNWANSEYKFLGGLNPETTYSILLGPDGIQFPNLTDAQKSNVVTFTTLEDKTEYEEHPLMPPLNFKVTEVTDSSITLGFIGSPKADGYDYWVNGDWIAGIWDGSNQFTYTLTDEQKAAGTELTFLVAAQNSEEGTVSEKSNEITITWGQLIPPRDLQVVTANRSTVVLGWAPTQGATFYEIYQDGTLIGTSESNRYVIEQLTEGQSYSYHVVARNNAWTSAPSDTIIAVPGANYTNVTYYTSWSLSPTGRNYNPEDVDVSQVTHINYAFSDLCWMKVSTNGTACQNDDIPLQTGYVYDGEMVLGDQEYDLLNFESFAAIKAAHPHLKLMVSVGGWSWSKNFSNMAATEITRRAFANSVVDFLRAYGIDGLDIDWEYPVEGGESHNTHRPEDKENFTLLMQTVRDALDAVGSVDGKYYLLTIASGQGDNFVVNADLKNAVNYLDFINIMTYDYSGSWEMLAHHNSPLYYDPEHPAATAPRNHVKGGLVGHLNGGVPNYKLTLGIPFYGKGWIGCPDGGQYATCTSIPPGTWESGIFDYTDVETNYLGQEGFTHHWNEAAKISYLYNSDTGMFITYNDPTTMMYTSSLVKSLDLAGVMSWEISGDRNRSLTTQLVKDLPIDGVVNEAALQAATQVRAVTSSSSIQLTWEAVDGATGYEVFMNDVYVKSVEQPNATISNLTSNTTYTFNVLAIKETEDKIVEVSPFSSNLTAKTLQTPQISGPAAPLPVRDKDELDASISRSDGKWTVSINKDASIQIIEAAGDVNSFKITVSDEAEAIDIIVPKEVVAAIRGKDAQAQLSVVWNGITYVVPAQAIELDADIQLSIAPVSDQLEDIKQLADESGLSLLSEVLDFNISKRSAANTWEDVTDFGDQKLSRIFTLKGKDIDPAKLTGVIFLPDSNEFRPVPSQFTVHKDGTLSAELKRDGNSIYIIAQSNVNYSDVKAAWMKEPVNRAAAKLLLDGESKDSFGVNSSITRAEFTSMIVKGLGILPKYGVAPFGDVPASSTYAGDIAAAKAAGIVHGQSATAFEPDAFISRQDVTMLLSNVLDYADVKTSADADASLDTFTDAHLISAYAKSAVSRIVEEGIMIGKSSSTFDPLSNLTRAEAAVIVIRILESLELD